MSTTDIINLGEVPVCSEAAVLPLNATTTGIWAFMTTFNGAYQYIQFQATQDQKIVVPAKLNEDYVYTFRLFTPDNTLFNNTAYCIKTMPLLPGIDYVCPSAEGMGVAYTMGKIKVTAIDGQDEITHLSLAGAHEVVVFIEGAIRQEGAEPDEYIFNITDYKIVFNTPLTEGQKITILYFK